MNTTPRYSRQKMKVTVQNRPLSRQHHVIPDKNESDGIKGGHYQERLGEEDRLSPD